ncbi:MAG: DUF6464 family protein [Cyanobacteria bacterium J06623_5]
MQPVREKFSCQGIDALGFEQASQSRFFMLIALIVVIGLIPALVSLILGLYARKSFQSNLQIAADYAARERLRHISTRPRHPEAHYVDGLGLMIGDITCQLNAKSPFIRCAANPMGPCKGCRDYEGRDYGELSNTD